MVEMVANSTDAAQEKHVPIVEYADGKVFVKVGEVNHPMLPEHYIGWVALETKKGAQRKELKPGDEPCVAFALTEDDEPVAAYAYCNLHGLWKKEF
jgi:superoxide reductase